MGITEDKIEIVPNGVNLSEFDNLPRRGAFRRKHNLKNNQKVILYLGRIYWIKGLDLLANAFADISKDFSQVKLVIAGPDDGYLPRLKKRIKELRIEEKVLFTGPLYGRDKLEAYVDADVYVLPSSYEIFGITVLEACACGTPVITTDRCGMADVIDGKAGLAVPYDKERLEQALEHLLSDDKMRLKFGEYGKNLVRGRFEWGVIAEQIESIYLACLSQRRSTTVEI
jgi:glycosyltransferase involved in cell wall biosynthesis